MLGNTAASFLGSSRERYSPPEVSLAGEILDFSFPWMTFEVGSEGITLCLTDSTGKAENWLLPVSRDPLVVPREASPLGVYDVEAMASDEVNSFSPLDTLIPTPFSTCKTLCFSASSNGVGAA